MVYVRLWGGLGNQLFQYAMGYAKAMENNTQLKLDISYYETERKRTPKIHNFKINFSEILVDKKILNRTKLLQRKNINRILRIPKISILKLPEGFRYFKESRLKFVEKYKTFNYKSVYLDGYWQCEKYFKKYKDDLLSQFNLITESEDFKNLSNEMGGCQSIAIHVRRGDYILEDKNWFSKLYILDLNYYKCAIEKVQSLFNNPRFYFFSDDIDWCQDNFSYLKSSEFVSSKYCFTDYEELMLMSKCKHQIIGNSTFSWWGAYLNKDDSKYVIAPDRWFGNRNIIPSNWHKIDWKGR